MFVHKSIYSLVVQSHLATKMAQVFIDDVLQSIRPHLEAALEQVFDQHVERLCSTLKLDEAKVRAALGGTTTAIVTKKAAVVTKTKSKIVSEKPVATSGASLGGLTKKLVLVAPYTDKSFAVTSTIPDDTKNIRVQLKEMDLKFNGSAKVGTACWIGQLSKVAEVENKLKALGLKYRKMDFAAYEKEVVASKGNASKEIEAEDVDDPDQGEEPAANAELDEEEVHVDVDKDASGSASGSESDDAPKTTKVTKSKTAPPKETKNVSKVAVEAKKNKWGNHAHEGYVFEKLPLGSNGAKVDVVIGVQDTKAPAIKKEYASILKLSEADLKKCAAKGWRTIDQENLIIIKKKDPTKYEALASILNAKAASPEKVNKLKTVSKVETKKPSKAKSLPQKEVSDDEQADE